MTVQKNFLIHCVTIYPNLQSTVIKCDVIHVNSIKGCLDVDMRARRHTVSELWILQPWDGVHLVDLKVLNHNLHRQVHRVLLPTDQIRSIHCESVVPYVIVYVRQIRMKTWKITMTL